MINEYNFYYYYHDHYCFHFDYYSFLIVIIINFHLIKKWCMTYCFIVLEEHFIICEKYRY